jgi:hypothetical protein
MEFSISSRANDPIPSVTELIALSRHVIVDTGEHALRSEESREQTLAQIRKFLAGMFPFDWFYSDGMCLVDA